MAALVFVKHVDHPRFLGRLCLNHGALAPGVVATGSHIKHLTEHPHRVVKSLLVHKLQLAHGVGVVESLRLLQVTSSNFFLESPTPALATYLVRRRARTLAASAGSAGKNC